MERVSFKTEDGIEIGGDWYPVNGEKFAILLHIRPATKESMVAWAKALNARGYSCLAYDQRGHGESTMNGTLNFESFTDEESRGKALDLEAAFAWLQGKGAAEANTVLVGGSIGGNLAIRFLAEHHGVPMAIALSPGLNYRGVASDDDPHGSLESCRRLHELAADRTVFVQKRGLGHGTAMTEKNPGLIDELLTYLP
jgi:alpha-beta hydrolase superfamily lysophospholipase